MPIVTFQNGKSVTFDKTPTPQDVDFVAKQMGITAESQAAPAPADTADHSWVTGDKHIVPQLGNIILGKPDSQTPNPIAGGIRPILNLPTSLLRGVEDVAKVVPSTIDLAYKQGLGGLGQAAIDLGDNLTKPFQWLGKNIAGGLSSGVHALTGKAIDPQAEAAFGQTVDAVKHPLDTATNIAQGIYTTSQENPMMIPLALEGGGQTLNRLGIKNIGPIATNDVISSIADPVIQGAKTAVEPILAPLQKAAFNKRVDEFNKVLNPSKGLAASEAKYEKNSPEFAAQLEREGVKFPFGKDGRGRLDTTAAQENVDAIAARDNATFGKLLESSGINTNLDQIAADARAEAIRTYKGTAQNIALQHIDDEMAAYKSQYADQGFMDKNGEFNVPGKIGNEIKQDLWSKSKFPPFGSPTDQTKAGSSFLMGQAIKNDIQDAIGSDNLAGRLNQRLGDIASLQKMLQKAQGGAIHGGFASRMAGRIVGGIAGSAGGPMGSIGGAITGDMISEALNNPNRPLSWSQMVLARAENEAPDILKEVEARIGKNAQEILSRKLLPAPAESGSATNPHLMGPATPPESGVTEPAKPGSLYNYLQNQEASQKAIRNVNNRGAFNKGQFLPAPPKLNVSTAREVVIPPKYSTLLDNVKSSVTDWNRAIESDDIPLETIYKPNGAFQPEPLDHVLSDLSGKMNMVQKGLGYEFKATFDASNPTPQNILEQASQFIKDAASKATKINMSESPAKDIILNDNAPFNTRAKAIESGQSLKEKNAVAARNAVKQNMKYPSAGLSTRDVTKLHPEDHDLLARGYEAYKDGTELSSSEELGLNRLLDHIGVNTNQSVAKVREQMLAVLNGGRSFKGTDLRNLTGPKSNFGRTQTASAAEALPTKKTVFGRSTQK